MRAIDWRALRGAVALFALALAIGAVAYGSTVRFREAASRSHDVQKQRLETIRARYRTIDEQRGLVESRLPEFRALEAAGIIGEEQRLTWIETLQEVAARVGLPSLRYRIEPRTPYEAGLDPHTGTYRSFLVGRTGRGGSAARGRFRTPGVRPRDTKRRALPNRTL